MICKSCGRQILNDEANFCEYCGNSLKDYMQQTINNVSQQQVLTDNIEFKTPDMEKEEPISFLNWIGSYGLMFIPIVGWLVFPIMLFVWAFGKKTPQSKKNWSRATLILYAVFIIFLLFYMVSFMKSPIYQELINGTFDINKYY
jgi:uncharacterized membrane protein YvbJ